MVHLLAVLTVVGAMKPPCQLSSEYVWKYLHRTVSGSAETATRKELVAVRNSHSQETHKRVTASAKHHLPQKLLETLAPEVACAQYGLTGSSEVPKRRKTPYSRIVREAEAEDDAEAVEEDEEAVNRAPSVRRKSVAWSDQSPMISSSGSYLGANVRSSTAADEVDNVSSNNALTYPIIDHAADDGEVLSDQDAVLSFPRLTIPFS